MKQQHRVALYLSFLGLPLSLAPRAAEAQTYVNTQRTESYVQLTSIPGIHDVNNLTFSSADDGQASNVPIGFTFNYLGNNFTTVNLGSNGYMTFGSDNASLLGNVAPGSTSSPFNWIAPMWDDLIHPSTSNGRYGTIGTAPNRIFVIEGGPATRYFGSGGTLFYQIRLYEAGTSHFEYRATGNPVNALLATVGYEGAGGVPSFNANGACSPNCTMTGVDGQVFETSIAVTPELTGSFGSFPRGAFPGQTAVVGVTLRNLGVNTATSVVADIYLSADGNLDPSDALVGSTMPTDVVGGNVAVGSSATITVPPTQAPGDYVLIMKVDAPNAYMEVNETDNIVAATSRFATAYDVRATAVTTVGAPGANAGDPITFGITIANDGVPYSGSLSIDVSVSLDQIADSGDPVAGPVTVALTGIPSEVVQGTVTLPATLPPGPYYPVVRVDPRNDIVELNESNNTFVGMSIFQVGADFSIGSVTVPAQIAPGSSGSVTTRISSNAMPYFEDVTYRLYASLDNTVDMTDVDLGLFTVTFAGQGYLDDTQNVTPPVMMPAGRYHVIAVVDPGMAIAELDENNNTTASSASFVNAVDYGVGTVTFSPASVEAGDQVTVTSSILSLGLPHVGDVPYRVYFSPNNEFDLADDPAYDGTVHLSGLNSAPLTATFTIPNSVQARSFYVIIVVDADNSIDEAQENNNWTSSASTLAIVGADLKVGAITGSPVAFIGIPYEVTLTIQNTGAADARDFHYAYYLSTNAIIRVTDQQIMVSGSVSVPSGGEVTLVDQIMMPTFTATQTLYLGVILDLYTNVPEDSETNNISHIDPALSIIFPIPDLRAQIVNTATAAAAGEQLAVTRVLTNSGVAEAPTFEYSYYLSSNPTISTDDILVGTFSSHLAAGQDEYGFDILQIPSDIAAGTYYLGLIVDPANHVAEVDELNNAVTGPQIPVYSAAIQFLTLTLPDATVGAPYQVGIYASGGPVGIRWAIQTGVLPDGLALDPISGIISGTPTREGLFPFVLRALSGTAYADRSFTIRAISPTVPLRVASATLPSAIVGREYSTQLVAVGGTVPYEWSAISELPDGLHLSATGTVSGIPNAPGNNRITVRVRDAVGTAASREVALNVISPSQKLVITQIVLPTGIVGHDYCEQDQIALGAMGGIPPYTWAVVGASPPGLSLSPDGTLCGVATEAGSFPLLVRVQDQTGLFDTSLFFVDIDDGRDLAIATFSLAAGVVGTAYDGALTAVRGDPPYQWSLVPGTGDLPPGLTLDAAMGHVTGTPSAAGVYAFTVQVIDAKNRSDLQALSIEIDEPPLVVAPPSSGCSCSATENDGSARGAASAALFAVLGLGLALRRRRSLAVLGLGALAVLAPSQAGAQPVPGTPYQKSVTEITYQNLSSPTVIFTTGDDSAVDVPIPFPFHYYDGTVTVASVGTNGALTFTAGAYISLSNEAPGSGSLSQFIAPFWDDMFLYTGTDHQIGYQVDGVAPDRSLTIEWRNLSRYSNSGVTFNMQVRMFEGPAARLQIDYGPLAGSGSFSSTMGMEDQMGGRPILFAPSGCTTSCTQTDFTGLTNHRVELVEDPGVELVALGIEAPQFGFLGAANPIAVRLGNLHGQVIGPFDVQIVASARHDLSNPTVVHSSQVTLQAFQSASITLDAVPPEALGEGLFYLGLLVDSGNIVTEVNESNNTAVSATEIRILEGKPDLAVQRVATDLSTANAGDRVPVVVSVANVGGQPANNVEVALMLSTNPVISPQDVQLATFSVSLAPGDSTQQTVNVTLPANLNSGSYYLGALADPQDMIEELNESNNGRASTRAITVSGGTLAVLTQSLPVGYLRVAYSGVLQATGGDGMRTWTITQGSLPAGIGLVPATGELFGRPMTIESQTFTVEVSSGGQTASQQLTMMVVSPEAPLTIVSRSVPSAVIGQEYSFALVATGGTQGSTLAWSATNLPAGISLSPEGVLGGTPSSANMTTFTVTVTDGTETATRDLQLTVADNANLLIVPTELPHARLSMAYSAQLEATGGVQPLTWLVQVGQLPAGLSLSTDGVLSGTPEQVGSFRVVIEVRDAAAPGKQAKDANTFELIVDDIAGFTIATTSLPDATVDEGYDQSIRTDGGAAPIMWMIAEGTLPDGLVSSVNTTTNELRIAGQPTMVGTSNILMTATDSQGRVATRAFALRVVPKPPMIVTMEGSSGCGCSTARGSSTGDFGVAALVGLFLAGLVLRSRRSTRP